MAREYQWPTGLKPENWPEGVPEVNLHNHVTNSDVRILHPGRSEWINPNSGKLVITERGNQVLTGTLTIPKIMYKNHALGRAVEAMLTAMKSPEYYVEIPFFREGGGFAQGTTNGQPVTLGAAGRLKEGVIGLTFNASDYVPEAEREPGRNYFNAPIQVGEWIRINDEVVQILEIGTTPGDLRSTYDIAPDVQAQLPAGAVVTPATTIPVQMDGEIPELLRDSRGYGPYPVPWRQYKPDPADLRVPRAIRQLRSLPDFEITVGGETPQNYDNTWYDPDGGVVTVAVRVIGEAAKPSHTGGNSYLYKGLKNDLAVAEVTPWSGDKTGEPDTQIITVNPAAANRAPVVIKRIQPLHFVGFTPIEIDPADVGNDLDNDVVDSRLVLDNEVLVNREKVGTKWICRPQNQPGESKGRLILFDPHGNESVAEFDYDCTRVVTEGPGGGAPTGQGPYVREPIGTVNLKYNPTKRPKTSVIIDASQNILSRDGKQMTFLDAVEQGVSTSGGITDIDRLGSLYNFSYADVLTYGTGETKKSAQVQITGRDEDGLQATDTATVDIAAPGANVGPTWQAFRVVLPAAMADWSVSARLTDYATDEDGDPLTFLNLVNSNTADYEMRFKSDDADVVEFKRNRLATAAEITRTASVSARDATGSNTTVVGNFSVELESSATTTTGDPIAWKTITAPARKYRGPDFVFSNFLATYATPSTGVEVTNIENHTRAGSQLAVRVSFDSAKNELRGRILGVGNYGVTVHGRRTTGNRKVVSVYFGGTIQEDYRHPSWAGFPPGFEDLVMGTPKTWKPADYSRNTAGLGDITFGVQPPSTASNADFTLTWDAATQSYTHTPVAVTTTDRRWALTQRAEYGQDTTVYRYFNTSVSAAPVTPKPTVSGLVITQPPVFPLAGTTWYPDGTTDTIDRRPFVSAGPSGREPDWDRADVSVVSGRDVISLVGVSGQLIQFSKGPNDGNARLQVYEYETETGAKSSPYNIDITISPTAAAARIVAHGTMTSRSVTKGTVATNGLYLGGRFLAEGFPASERRYSAAVVGRNPAAVAFNITQSGGYWYLFEDATSTAVGTYRIAVTCVRSTDTDVSLTRFYRLSVPAAGTDGDGNGGGR